MIGKYAKQKFFFGVLLVDALVIVAAAPARAETTRFKQWIAPLECTESRIVDGENVTTILTPAECDDLLHPKPPDNGGDNGSGNNGGQQGGGHAEPQVPGAPNTGFFRDPLIGSGIFAAFLIFTVLLVGYARRRSRDHLSK